MDIRLINIGRSFHSTKNTQISALSTVNLDVNEESYISFVGPTGSGKSTLLNIVTGVLHPSHGDIYWGRNSLSKTSDRVISKIRREKFGIVFQEPRFVDELNVEENILLPLVFNGQNLMKKKEYYETLCEKLKLGGLKKQLPSRLSGGEKRKVAIARALISNPEVLIADEPTSNLDDHAADEVFSIFSNLNRLGLTLLVATHDERFANYAKETYFLEKGKIVDFRSKEDA